MVNHYHHRYFRNSKGTGFSVFFRRKYRLPSLPRIEQIDPDDRAVVELSSFQLISRENPLDVAGYHQRCAKPSDVHKGYAGIYRRKTQHLSALGGISRTINVDNEITALPAGDPWEAMQFSRRITPALGCYLAEDGTLLP